VPECLGGAGGAAIPEGADACWIAKTGDELAPECVAAKRNLEFELVRRLGVPVPSDVSVTAACELSSFASDDCG
jgi:hypothetical protein